MVLIYRFLSHTYLYCSRKPLISECRLRYYAAMERNRAGFTTADIEKFKPVDYSIAQVDKDEIKYILFQHYEPDNGVYVTENSIKDVSLDRALPTKVFIHGWNSSGVQSPWYAALREGYFKISPHNIIYVDYTIPGSKSYAQSTANVMPVGKFIGQFLLATKIPHEKIHLISHSLGSHVATFIGKEIFELSGKKIARITALDPAGPMFESEGMPDELRLNKNDAEFVDVIHTDIHFSGFGSPIGHVDFYPNYGIHQPGCPKKELDDVCSHARSKFYFIESLTMRNSRAKEAKTIGRGKRTNIEVIEDGKEIFFGDNVPVTARGVYFLKTNSEAPFLISDQ